VRVRIYTVAIPFLTAVAFAQDTPPPQPQPPSQQATPSVDGKTAKDKDKNKDKDKSKDTTAGDVSSNRPAEMKTQSYSGTLMDASCAGSTSATTSSTPATASGSADRAAPSADNASCTVSASTTQFAIKTKDGQTVKFDDVGNMRAQEALKAHKKWTESAAANKPVRVKASGVLNGDVLTVVSIN